MNDKNFEKHFKEINDYVEKTEESIQQLKEEIVGLRELIRILYERLIIVKNSGKNGQDRSQTRDLGHKSNRTKSLS